MGNKARAQVGEHDTGSEKIQELQATNQDLLSRLETTEKATSMFDEERKTLNDQLAAEKDAIAKLNDRLAENAEIEAKLKQAQDSANALNDEKSKIQASLDAILGEKDQMQSSFVSSLIL